MLTGLLPSSGGEMSIDGLPVDRAHIALIRTDDNVIATGMEPDETATGAMKRLTPFLPNETEAHQLFIRSAGGGDMICGVPCPNTPQNVLRTYADLSAARAEGQLTAWCTIDAIADTPHLELVSLALFVARGRLDSRQPEELHLCSLAGRHLFDELHHPFLVC